VKKKPDFAKIHEKMFAKSESLVDAKKRLEDRHIAFSNLIMFIILKNQQFLKVSFYKVKIICSYK
jgi:hypothetical protein